MKTFQDLWKKDPAGAVSAFLALRDVEHYIAKEMNSLGIRTKVHFRGFESKLWVIEAYDANNQFDPRLSIGLYSSDEPELDLWDVLHLVGQEKLYHCTSEECIFLAFNLLADVEKIVSGELKPVRDPYRAW